MAGSALTRPDHGWAQRDTSTNSEATNGRQYSFSTAHHISNFAWGSSTPPSSHPGCDSFSTAKHLLHPNCASSTSSSIFLAKGPPTQLDDYDFGCEEDISHRRSRRVKAADFFSQAPDRPDSPPSALRAFQPPSPANHTDIITSSHSSPQLQPNPTPAIPHPGLVFEQSATRIRTSHS